MGEADYLRSIFNSMSDSILAVDERFVVVAANDSFMCLSDIEEDNLVGESIDIICQKCNCKCINILKMSMLSGENIQGHRVYCDREDRAEQVISLDISMLDDDIAGIAGAVLIIKDLTKELQLEDSLKERQRYNKIIGKCQAFKKLYVMLDNLALFDSTVLIIGETGAGKDVFAETIHESGPRYNKPYVKINCAALPDQLVENELFGHARGAYTGAQQDSKGLIAEADGGTLFLDEIGDLSQSAQAKLLRFIESKEYQRIGDPKTYSADVRVIAATNADLESKVANKSFRADLFYRLNVFKIAIPPLRERLPDIPLLVGSFIAAFRTSMKKDITHISPEALNILLAHSWPGNVRELKHAVEYAFIVATGPTILPEHLPQEIMVAMPSEVIISRQETPCCDNTGVTRDNLLAALEKAHWNKTKAAQILGVNRRTVHRHIRKHGF